jgi:hypothetical protein
MIGDIMWWEFGTIEELYTFHKVRKGRALEKSRASFGWLGAGDRCLVLICCERKILLVGWC